MMLTKYCNIFFIKRFTATMDPILIVLLKFILENSKFKSGRQGPCGLLVPPPMSKDQLKKSNSERLLTCEVFHSLFKVILVNTFSVSRWVQVTSTVRSIRLLPRSGRTSPGSPPEVRFAWCCSGVDVAAEPVALFIAIYIKLRLTNS